MHISIIVLIIWGFMLNCCAIAFLLIKNASESSGTEPFKIKLAEIDYHLHKRDGLEYLAIDAKDYVMPQRLIIAAAWTCLAFIVFATLSSLPARPVIAGGLFTIVERFGAYGVLGCLLYLAYPRHLVFVCVIVFGSAVTLELLQNLIPDRHPRALDAIEKLLGGVAGIVSTGIRQSSIWPKFIPTIGQPRRN